MAKFSNTTDLATLSAGSLILAVLSSNLLQEGSNSLLDGRHQHLLQAVLGASLLLWPIVRRLVRRICSPDDAVEFADLTLNLRRIGLSNRVMTINLYLAQQSDDAWRSVFPTV
jgi:hypothetical protein